MTTLDFGVGGVRRFARPTGRTIGDGMGAMRYPSPFFDIASTYMPQSFKQMLKWCRYYFLSNPLINAVCYKMAQYPVTDLIFDTDNEVEHKRWSSFFNDTLKFKKFEVEVGLDFNVYGNAFIGIFYPFLKWLKCPSCSFQERVERVDYRFTNLEFHGTCPKCSSSCKFTVVDQHIRSARDIRLIRWDPEQITIQHNDATGESQYYYTIPPRLANDLRMGKRSIVEKTPQIFLEALRGNKSLLFTKDNLFHLKRPTIAQKDKGWGLPMILPVLKDTFYLQILRKAQEAIAVEHITPLRLLFPTTSSSGTDPYSTVNISLWKQKIEQEILRWRQDNLYIPILPLPVGQQTLGGEGRALMLAQEYRVWAEWIVAGMGVPVEIIFGGVSFSGSNVSLRILENAFLDYKSDHQMLVQDFIMPRIAAFMDWKPIPTHFKRFKMADDLQRSAFNLQLNQAGKLSDHSLLEDMDWDSNLEMDRIGSEQRKNLSSQRVQAEGQARIQGETQLILQKYQLRAQKEMEASMPQVPGGPAETGMAPFPAAGGPGASPDMIGQFMLNQQGSALASGQMQAPPIAPPGTIPEQQDPQAAMGSQLNESQAMTDVPPESLPVPVTAIAQQLVSWLDGMPDAQKQEHLSILQKNNPQLYAFVSSMLTERQGAHASSAAKPLPDVRMPRRGAEARVI